MVRLCIVFENGFETEWHGPISCSGWAWSERYRKMAHIAEVRAA